MKIPNWNCVTFLEGNLQLLSKIKTTFQKLFKTISVDILLYLSPTAGPAALYGLFTNILQHDECSLVQP